MRETDDEDGWRGREGMMQMEENDEKNQKKTMSRRNIQAAKS